MNKNIKNSFRINVLGVGVSPLNMSSAVSELIKARKSKQSGYVCITGAHGIIESQYNDELINIHNKSMFTMPDGMPTVWMGLEQGFLDVGRVYGPDLMLNLIESSSNKGLTHFLYGSTEETLLLIKKNLRSRYPKVNIVGTFAPPFRELNTKEEMLLFEKVSDCKPDFFWIGLSTPKQECFMAKYINQCEFGIMIGVGAAFNIHAGLQKDAPNWVKNSGFQWFYRLCQEPRRLWRRYLHIVPKFLYFSFLQIFGLKKYTIK